MPHSSCGGAPTSLSNPNPNSDPSPSRSPNPSPNLTLALTLTRSPTNPTTAGEAPALEAAERATFYGARNLWEEAKAAEES